MLSTEICKKFIENKGGKLSPDWKYDKSDTKFELFCKKEHKWETCWNVVQSNHWCPHCAKEKANEERKLKAKNFEGFIRNFIANKEGKLDLDWKYKNNFTVFWIECSLGHRWQASWQNLKQKNSWCPYCHKHTVDEKAVIEYIKDKGAKISENWKYESAKTKFSLVCSEGHNFISCWDKIRAGHWCPFCFGNNKPDEDMIRELVKSKKGFLDADWKYENSLTKFWVSCKKGHRWQTIWLNLGRDHWCPHCRTTRTENEFRKTMERFFSDSFPKTKPEWLKNPLTNRVLELDGFNQDKRVAFEYQGPFHYENVINGREFEQQKKRDEIKVQKCKENNVLLIIMPYWISKKDWVTEIDKQIRI